MSARAPAILFAEDADLDARRMARQAKPERFAWVPESEIRAWSEVSPGGAALLLALRLHANPATGGSCFPSLETLQQLTGWSRKKVYTVLDRAEAAGLVTRGKRHTGRPGRPSNQYLLPPIVSYPQDTKPSGVLYPGDTLKVSPGNFERCPRRRDHTQEQNQEHTPPLPPGGSSLDSRIAEPEPEPKSGAFVDSESESMVLAAIAKAGGKAPAPRKLRPLIEVWGADTVRDAIEGKPLRGVRNVAAVLETRLQDFYTLAEVGEE